MPILKRSTSGLVYVVLFLGAILFSEVSYIVLISFFGIVAIWEFSKIVKFESGIPYLLLLLGVYYFITNDYPPVIFGALILTLLCSIRLVVHLYNSDRIYPNTLLEKLDLFIRYLILPFCYLIILPYHKGVYTPSIIIGVLCLIWTNDTFAFLVGRSLGKRKLFESVSPNKTVEGFIGGVVFSLLTGILFYYYAGIHTFLDWIFIALIVSIIGSIGDLVESKFKRQAKVKDSGSIMPGHGGILDRLDSLIFVVPFVYLYLNYIS